MLNRFALAIAPLLAGAALLLSATANAQGESAATADVDPAYETVQVVLETTMGDILVALETERAPITAANFLRYVDEDRFDGIVFYRAMQVAWGEQPNGLVQAGTQYDPERVLDPIAHEPTTLTGLTHSAGALSMARYEPDTATGDFSILLQPQPGMDADPGNDDPNFHDGFAVFGHVVEGMEVVRAIHAAPVDPDKGVGFMKGQMLADPVTITEARRMEPATP